MGADIFMREQGSIVFNISNTLTIATPIEGDQTSGPNTTGGVQKLGAGILNLNGTNTYSGATHVDGGKLNIVGNVIGDVVVASTGTFYGNGTVGGSLTSSGTLQSVINTGGSASQVAVTGVASLAGTLDISLHSNAQTGTYTILTSPSITGTFNAVTFTQTTPISYTVSYLPAGAPTSVQIGLSKVNGTSLSGSGTIAGPSGPVTIEVEATYNMQNQIVATMFLNDPGAGVHFDNPVVTSLIFNGTSVTFGGTVNVNNQNVTFTTTAVGGSPGTISVSLGNGYSVSGTLTSGGISVQ